MHKNIFIWTVAFAVCLASCKSSDSERARFAVRSLLPEVPSSELFKILKPESQHFEFKANIDTVFRASGGTKVLALF